MVGICHQESNILSCAYGGRHLDYYYVVITILDLIVLLVFGFGLCCDSAVIIYIVTSHF